MQITKLKQRKISNDHYPRLNPIISPWITQILSQKNKLEKNVDKFGSPLNINNPKILIENVNLFRSVLKKHKLKLIHYTLFCTKRLPIMYHRKK